MRDDGSDARAVLAEARAALEMGDEASAMPLFERASELGCGEASYQWALALEEMDENDLAEHAYKTAWDQGHLDAGVQLAFIWNSSQRVEEARRVVEEAAARGSRFADAVSACWDWIETNDLALEPRLRAGYDIYTSARVSLSHLLVKKGDVIEARDLLIEGTELGQTQSFLPLGNIFMDFFNDSPKAKMYFQEGIQAGDIFCYNNLGLILRDEGDRERARELFRLVPDWATAWRWKTLKSWASGALEVDANKSHVKELALIFRGLPTLPGPTHDITLRPHPRPRRSTRRPQTRWRRRPPRVTWLFELEGQYQWVLGWP